MNITQDVVTDLLPLYFSGEASADSRAVVESFFREHPEFERVARKSVKVEMPAVSGPEAAGEKEVMRRVKRILRARSILLGSALFCTVAPFSVAGEDGDVTWFMLRDLPEAAALFWLGALILWGAYYQTFRALRDTQ